MWRAVQEWQKIAEEINAGKEGKDRKPLYVYAHNGSKFDAIVSVVAQQHKVSSSNRV